MARTLTQDEIKERLRIVLDEYAGSSQAACKDPRINVNRRTLDKFMTRHASEEKLKSLGQLEQTETVKLPIPEKGCTRYLLTCAQNSTKVHDGFWKNLTAFADIVDAEIMVSGFTYNKTLLNTKNEKKETQSELTTGIWYAPEVADFITSELTEIAPTLAWCSNLQILPTAVRPDSGLDDYTGEASTIIPHPKVLMRPVPTAKDKPTKHIYTTGTCTLKNYIKQKSGLVAEFHHVFGALLVEVLPDGSWFTRQITADSRGNFDDCGTEVSMRGGEAKRLNGVAVASWGDIHRINIDKDIESMLWGKGGMLDTLKPKYQIFNDLTDGESHNPHEQKNHHNQYKLHLASKNNIRDEFDGDRHFVDCVAHRDWCKSIVIWSNHDEFIKRYLQHADYRKDHVNASFILRLELEAYEAMDAGREPDLYAKALNSCTAEVYSDDNESLVIETIDFTRHGHTGNNGSRGSVVQFAKSGAKTSTGHSHAAWIIAGASSAGTCSKMDMGYNKGFSSWSHTQTVTHKGGKRQQVTCNASTGFWRGGVVKL
tara:strand:- start:213 stop:1832 length:1620 start_codon:yes stop_codon:yes gene_type:complete